jgi:hypothetical protein
MAFATAKTETKTVQKEVSEKVVKLELSIEEAQFLYAVTMRIGGHPEDTYRGIADDIRLSLVRVGTTAADTRFLLSSGGLVCKARRP